MVKSFFQKTRTQNFLKYMQRVDGKFCILYFFLCIIMFACTFIIQPKKLWFLLTYLKSNLFMSLFLKLDKMICNNNNNRSIIRISKKEITLEAGMTNQICSIINQSITGGSLVFNTFCYNNGIQISSDLFFNSKFKKAMTFISHFFI